MHGVLATTTRFYVHADYQRLYNSKRAEFLSHAEHSSTQSTDPGAVRPHSPSRKVNVGVPLNLDMWSSLATQTVNYA